MSPVEGMQNSFQRAEGLFRDIKDVCDELNILKSAVRFRKTVQKSLLDGNIKDMDVSAEYIENDIAGMEDVADRIQSAVSFPSLIIGNMQDANVGPLQLMKYAMYEPSCQTLVFQACAGCR
ncbi:hypothetical protein IL306_002537 [Fusarium sp. DS 682]|nr:hypothetical protein IL306_002537 [Fusarium sp. DS 682]